MIHYTELTGTPEFIDPLTINRLARLSLHGTCPCSIWHCGFLPLFELLLSWLWSHPLRKPRGLSYQNQNLKGPVVLGGPISSCGYVVWAWGANILWESLYLWQFLYNYYDCYHRAGLSGQRQTTQAGSRKSSLFPMRHWGRGSILKRFSIALSIKSLKKALISVEFIAALLYNNEKTRNSTKVLQ